MNTSKNKGTIITKREGVHLRRNLGNPIDLYISKVSIACQILVSNKSKSNFVRIEALWNSHRELCNKADLSSPTISFYVTTLNLVEFYLLSIGWLILNYLIKFNIKTRC